jgi:gliding motility-associated-like protein
MVLRGLEHYFLFISLHFCIVFCLTGQVPPPEPCDDGSQATCQCENSPVLCTIDDLDGFEYSMSGFQHPEDGPEFLCNGEGVPNNPTWFSFVAWCEELELEVELDNCSEVCLTGGSCDFICNLLGNCASGVQIAIYGDCNFNEEVACNVQDCNNEDNKTLSMSNLIIGKTYHFVIDGCGGSACDFVRVNVVGTCGDPRIEDWRNPIQGADQICLDETATYFVDSLDGANEYIWSIDGVDVDTTQVPQLDVTWDQEGSFNLCVEASNERCPVTDGPDEICLIVNVLDPGLGDINVDSDSICPQEMAAINIIGANPNPVFDLAIIVVDENDTVRQLDLAPQTNFQFNGCGNFIVYGLQFQAAVFELPEVGDVFLLPNCAQSCCDWKQEQISFVDDEPPFFNNPPLDTVYGCLNAISEIQELSFEDNCSPPGFSMGGQEGIQGFQDGDTIIRQWSIVDNCGNETQHIQNIQIRQNATVEVNVIPTTAEVFLGETVGVEIMTNLEEDAISNILWEPSTNINCADCLNARIDALNSQEYTITVTDINGCRGMGEFQLIVKEPDIKVFIPNTFSPNGDGINDGFTLFANVDLQIEELLIFDRWGNKVFESRNFPSNNPELGWKGRYDSTPLPNGVYIYAFLVRYSDGTFEYFKGDIAIIR